jgi:O2-independent ubiquinone biosynthesis protein UbiV
VLNGIQTQSAALHCLIDQAAALREAGVASVRLSPCATGFARVVRLFDETLNQGASARDARAELVGLDLPGELVAGYSRRRPGMEIMQT